MFCGNPTGADEYAEHAACRNEYASRRVSGVCTRCGDVPAEDFWCADCHNAGGLPFRGYPGAVGADCKHGHSGA